MYNLVQVRAVRYPANTLLPSNLLNEYELVLTRAPNGKVSAWPNPQGLRVIGLEAPLDKRVDNILRGNAPELRWPQYEIMLLDFDFVGESVEAQNYGNATEWNMREGNGVAADMSEDAVDLWRISAQLLDNHNCAAGVQQQQVRWLAVFNFVNEGTDRIDPVPSCYSEFIGRLDLATLQVVDIKKGMQA